MYLPEEIRKFCESPEKCLVCNEYFNSYQALNGHIKSHDMKSVEYGIKYYDDIPIHRKIMLTNRLLKEFLMKNYIYSARKDKYLLMDHNGSIQTVKSSHLVEKYRKHFKNENIGINAVRNIILGRHLNNGERLGVYFGENTRLIAFDIDNYRVDILKALKSVLKAFGIGDESLIISHSGNKGYHLDLILDSPVSREVAKAFFKQVKLKAAESLEDTSDINFVEGRGFSNAGYFLPFGRNYKSESYNQCYLTNENGDVLDNYQLFKLLVNFKFIDSSLIEKQFNSQFKDSWDSIRIITAAREKVFEDSYIDSEMQEIIEEVNQSIKNKDKMPYRTTPMAVVKAFNKLDEIESGTRHNKAFVYAIAARDAITDDYNDLLNIVLNWQFNRTGYKSSKYEVLKDTEAIVKSVLIKKGSRWKYNLPSTNRLYITKENIINASKINDPKLFRIYIALVVHGNYYQDENFYMTYEQINTLLNMNLRRGTILSYIIELEELELIKIVRRSYRKDNNLKYEPNVYRINSATRENVNSEEIYYLDENYKFISSDFFEAACRNMMTRGEIQTVFGTIGNMKKVSNRLKAA